jgi:hypothetical protein
MDTTIKVNSKAPKKSFNEFQNIIKQGFFDMNLSYIMPFEYQDKTDLTYIEEYFFDIHFNNHEDDTKIKIATGQFKIFNTSMVLNDEENPISVFDSSFENCQIYTSFYEYGTCEIQEELAELNGWDNCFRNNIAFFDRMEIIEEFRGKALGHFFLTKICNWLSSKVDLFIFKSFPLQYEGEVTDYNKAEFEKAHNKLNDYYASMGFKRVKFPEKENDGEVYFYHDMATVLKGKYKF